MHKSSLKESFRNLALILVLSLVTVGYIDAAKPKTFTVVVDDKEKEITSGQDTIRQALEEDGFIKLDGAKSSIDLDQKLEKDLKVDITTLKNYELVVGGISQDIEAYANSVGDLLTEQEVQMDHDDQVSPSADTKLKDGDKVVVDYYETKITTETQTVAFEETKQNSSDLFKGETKVSQEGKEGQREIDTKTITKNGEVVETSTVRDEVVTQPVNKVILVGTKEKPKPKPQPQPTRQASSNQSYTYSQVGSEKAAKEWIAQKESGGSYTAYNPRGGYWGRYQLGPHLIAYGAGPAEQERVADNYVRQRYGNWVNAQRFWQANGWY